MNQSPNLYADLDLDKTATAADIKKRYRELARKHHPDVNPNDPAAEARFKSIQCAYDILSDPEKRARYDNPIPETGGFSGFGGGGFDPFGGFNPFGTTHPVRRPFNTDRDLTVSAPAEATLNRFVDKITYTRTVGCAACQGKGGVSEPTTCEDCNGSGMRSTTQAHGNARFVSHAPCGRCKQRGKIYNDRCQKCDGFGLIRETIEQKLDIPIGWAGRDFIVDGGGDQQDPTQPPGKLILRMRVAEHTKYRFEGHNLVYSAPIDPVIAILGGEIQVPTLDGAEITITVPPGSPHGRRECVHGQGLYRSESDRGALFVSIEITPPSLNDLTSKETAVLRDYLAMRGERLKTVSSR